MFLKSNELNEAVELRINEIAEKSEYPAEAIGFVLLGLHKMSLQAYIELAHEEHTDARALSWYLHDQAMKLYAENAKQQLENWGITTTTDFGKIVYELIAEGLAKKTDRDSIEDFNDVFQFETAFQEFHLPKPSTGGMQWRLSTLLAITTVASIAFAGAGSLGFQGSIGALFFAWLSLIGCGCLMLGITDRSKDWLLVVGVGVVVLTIGISGVFLYTMR